MTFSKYAQLYIGVKQGSKKHKFIVDFYNTIKPLPRGYRVKYTDNWCATFVSFVLKSCGVTKDVFECGAQKMYDKFKSNKLIIKDKTKGKTNDIIFYDWQNNNWIDHVGIISKVTTSNYLVIEGNKSKQVGTRTIKRDSDLITGIGRIKK